MKSFLINILLVGLLIIPALGGYVLYKIQDVRRQVEAFLNISLAKIQDVNTRLDFDLFQCDGIVKIECRSSRIDILRNETPILSLSNLVLSLKDFDSKSLNLDFSSSIQNIYGFKGSLDNILPKTLMARTKFEFPKAQELLAKSVIKLNSKSLDYQLETISTMDIDSKQQSFLNYLQEADLKQERIYLSNTGISLNRKKNETDDQKGQLSHLAGLFFVLNGLYQKEYGFSPAATQIFGAVMQILLNKRDSLQIALKEKICLTCGEFDLKKLQELFEQNEVEIR